MNIYIGADHAGFELKELLIASLGEIGHTVVDCGAYAEHDGDDYPLFISKVARAISEAESVRIAEEDAPTLVADPNRYINETKGIVIGGSGQGEAIVANKFKHVRAALCYGGSESSEIVKLSREHNNANILSLGARFLSHDQALELTLLWLRTEFTGDIRHIRRIHEIDSIESSNIESLYE
jgi:ribose 5-phosphate isomerase B